MAENFYTILTQIGLAKVANSQITSSKIDISTIAVGDGNGAYYNPASNATALKREVWRGAAGSVEIDSNNPNWVVIETVIPSTVGGFTVREVGLFDVAGDLIAIGKYPETYKPVLAEGSSKDLYIRMIIEVANATAVTLKVDPAIIIASRKYVDDKVAQSVGGVDAVVQEVKNGAITILPLNTSDKTLAGAINEVNAKADGNASGLTTHLADDASITKKGHVQLSSAVTSTDETKAATPKAVKTAMDRADAAFTSASNGKSLIGTAITGVDDNLVVPTDPTFQNLADLIGSISTGKKWASGTTTVSATSIVATLDFKPSIILMRDYYPGASRGREYVYLANSYGADALFLNDSIFTNTPGNSFTAISAIVTVTDNGFTLNKQSNYSGFWIAFE